MLLIQKKQTLILAIAIFIFAFIIRLIGLNDMGRTFDEVFYISEGWRTYNALFSGDFFSPVWYANPDPPIVSKLLYGLSSFLDIESVKRGIPVFHYDLTYSRLLSAFFTSILCSVVFYFGSRKFSLFVGISSGVILSLLPIFLGFSQIVSLESPRSLIFTLVIYLYILLLEKPSKKLTVLCAILSAIALFTKYTNGLLFVLFVWLYFIRVGNVGKIKFSKKDFILFVGVVTSTLLILWPQFFLNITYILHKIFYLRLTINQYSVPEVFFGKLMHVPKIYFFIEFLITTPIVLLGLLAYSFTYISKLNNPDNKLSFYYKKQFAKNKFYFSLKHILKRLFLIDNGASKKDKNKIWLLFALTAWFIVPFILSFYNFRQQGVRYIIEIYVPFVLLVSIGLEYIFVKIFKKIRYAYFALAFLVLYLILILISVKPYYFDYFNEVVGGPSGVYGKHLFHLAWWGEGLKEAYAYIKNDAVGKIKIGAAVTPIESIPKDKSMHVELYDETKKYDYVIVSFYQKYRLLFSDEGVIKKYRLVYEVKVGGAPMIKVYKAKK